MKIHNMSVTKHHDKGLLELHVQVADRRMFSVFFENQAEVDELPVILARAGAQLRNLILNETQNVNS